MLETISNIFGPINIFIQEILIQLIDITGSLGLAIIVFTLVVRALLLPLTIKATKSQEELKKLKPELDKLKKKHKDDPQELQKAQMELYQKYNVNPLAGCLPQLVQIGLLIGLYQVFLDFFQHTGDIDTVFLGIDMVQPDTTYILPTITAAVQFIFSLAVFPGGETRDIVPNDSDDKAVQEANEKEEDTASMAASMQQQLMYIMPAMTFFFALQFPAGLVLYWFVTTLFSLGQQIAISGTEGLERQWIKLREVSSNALGTIQTKLGR
jgi:YidC/Oxa1 family membrane protein insertase